MINQKENDKKKKRKIRTKQHSALINHFPSFSIPSPLEMETQTACTILKKLLSFFIFLAILLLISPRNVCNNILMAKPVVHYYLSTKNCNL